MSTMLLLNEQLSRVSEQLAQVAEQKAATALLLSNLPPQQGPIPNSLLPAAFDERLNALRLELARCQFLMEQCARGTHASIGDQATPQQLGEALIANVMSVVTPMIAPIMDEGRALARSSVAANTPIIRQPAIRSTAVVPRGTARNTFLEARRCFMRTIKKAIEDAEPLDSRVVEAFIRDRASNVPSVNDTLLIDNTDKLGSPWNTAIIDCMAERFLGQIIAEEFDGVSAATTKLDLGSLAKEIKASLTRDRARRVKASKMNEIEWLRYNKRIQKRGRRNTRRHDRFLRLGTMIDNRMDGNPTKWKALRNLLDECGARAMSSDESDVELTIQNKTKTVRRVRKPWVARGISAAWHGVEDRDFEIKSLKARTDPTTNPANMQVEEDAGIATRIIRDRTALDRENEPVTKEYLMANVQRGLPLSYYDPFFLARVPEHIKTYLNATADKTLPDITFLRGATEDQNMNLT